MDFPHYLTNNGLEICWQVRTTHSNSADCGSPSTFVQVLNYWRVSDWLQIIGKPHLTWLLVSCISTHAGMWMKILIIKVEFKMCIKSFVELSYFRSHSLSRMIRLWRSSRIRACLLAHQSRKIFSESKQKKMWFAMLKRKSMCIGINAQKYIYIGKNAQNISGLPRMGRSTSSLCL